jgi:F-type H+-transporting ATPase subunit b
MVRMKRKPQRIIPVILFLAALSFLLNTGLAIASGEDTHGSAQGNVHAGTVESAHGGEHGKDRSGDLRDLLYRFINFALLIIILFVAIKKSGLKDSLAGRIDEIKAQLENLRNEKEEAEGKYQDLEKKLKDFETEKKEIIEQFQNEGQVEKERIIAEANERAKQIVRQAELTIQQEMQSAKERLRREVMELAAGKAKEIIAKEMTDEDQDRLISEFIERVGKIH